MGSPPLARRERHALCDLALLLGEDAPTVLPDWTAKDLVVHLLVREYSPVGALGLAVDPLSGLTEREMARVGRRDFTVLVERLRGRGLTPYSLGPVDRVANTLEYVVHHEDLRRAQPDWQPRDLPPGDADVVWRLLRVFGRGLVRQAGVPVRIAPRGHRRRGRAAARLRPGRGERAARRGRAVPLRTRADPRRAAARARRADRRRCAPPRWVSEARPRSRPDRVRPTLGSRPCVARSWSSPC